MLAEGVQNEIGKCRVIEAAAGKVNGVTSRIVGMGVQIGQQITNNPAIKRGSKPVPLGGGE